ncbi:protein unc-79 homolog isoform X4 [Anopheles maculipalpis]|uniref:protein unc-79 homolog isoform X4 n=1 Tax=Anopheles maculipalpis TaxID=1496333 RepID=UPI002158CDF9|nr:protein unc-79 homolog isoform X4 [Anopheles maculipalpis]
MTGSFRIQLINMNTRNAAFQAKLRCLHDFHVRLLGNQAPGPTGSEVANTIKYFSQTLLTVLKDVPCSPLEMIKDPSLDQIRMSSYPNLEYQNLYNALTMLLDVASNIQSGLQLFGKAFLQCLGCILPFLDRDLIDNLPYLTASSISVLPSSLHQDIINYLCYYILPFTITRQSDDDQECHACQSVSAVIMLVFQYSTNPAHHCQLLECLMRLKHNVAKDLLCVIGYGTAMSRASAAKLLFYYWPAFDPNLFDRKGLLCKFTNDLVPFVCQRESCPNAGNAEAVKVCYDHCISILYASDAPPPLYLCIECANEIHRDHRNLTFGDILHPMQQVSMVCENKNCRSHEKSAVSICFSNECASYNGNHPIRYCLQCHGNRHNSRRGIDHIVHRSLPPMMMMDAEMQTYLVESVISLLREAKPLNVNFRKDSANLESKANASGTNGGEQQIDMLTLEERQLLGRYGIWLLVGRCTPTVDTPVEILGRLLSMLFHWFHVTAYSYDGQTESTLEKLKQDHICSWLKEVRISHYKEFIDCLLPHPPEYSRVGGHWDSLASRTSHLKEGLQRLICLIPYEIITQEIWDTVMPHWMEAITNDVPEKELIELKIVLNKILDAEMSPLGFDARAMYNFVAIRFEKTTAKVQQQALYWLQNLTKLEIVIPLPQLFAMFGDGVRIMKHGVQAEINKSKDSSRGGSSGGSGTKFTKERDLQPPRRSSISPVVEDESGNTSAISDDEVPMSKCMEFSTDAEHNLTCCVLMLDILLRQMELQEIEMHSGIYTTVAENVCRLLKCMVTAANVGMGNHSCRLMDCAYCETSVMWHQLSTKLVQYLAPINPVNPPDPPLQIVIDDEKIRKSPPELEKEVKSNERDISLSMAPLHIPLGPLVMPSILDDAGKVIIMAGPVPVAVPQPEPHSVGGVLVHMPHVCSIMTATVETVSEQLDLAAIMPSEKVVPAVARSVTLSEADVATATVQIAKPNVIGESSSEGGGLDSENLEGSHPFDGDEEFWHTSVGKFKFSIDTLPQSLQFIYQLLKEIPNIDKADILYYVLQCLNVMVLHGDAFVKAARDNRGFFIWCQENMLIKNLWELCTAAQSHICQVTVPTLLHCVTLPMGSDVFWKVIQEAFHDADWRVRFEAVERVTVITRFMDSTPLRAEVSLQTALATAFCHLIAACDDLNVHVAQRATLYLGTIHDYAIQALLYCLESQFDKFIIDRPVVLQSIYQLHNSLSDRKVLTWDFFLNRFDTLFVEAQVNLERVGDISYLRDLRNSENGSEILSTKINKAREALSQSDTTGSMSKTLSASFGTKWPYKRTMSAPATIIPRQESKIEKEKVYSRQVSAPILKRKSSRFGLDGHVHSISGQNEDFHLGSLYRVIDLEEADKETIHLLVFLMMQFMSRPDLAYPTDEKPLFKIQSIVLRHLYLLLGYNQGEKFFHVSPARLRCSSVFNAFMANLPQVLDQNHQMGWLLLPTVIQLLLYAPNQSNGAFMPPGAGSGNDQNHHNNVVTYNFSIWYLEPHVRRNWLMSLLVILYKYQYNQASMADQVQNLIRLVINSLDAQFHKCRRIPTTIIMDYSATRLRNQSQPSLGTTSELGDEKRTINDSSPPYSPLQTTTLSLYGCEESSKGRSSRGKAGGKVRKHPEADGDDTESELVVIPESDVSDSTIQESSVQGSLEDTASNDDDSNALKPDAGGKVKEGLASLSRTNLSIICGAPKIALGVQQHQSQQGKAKKSQQASVSLDQADISGSTITNSKEPEKVSTVGKPEKTEKTSSNIFRMPSAFQMSSQKCSVQEGVRMMVTSSMLGQPKAQAILNPFANVQKAIVVTQSTSSGSSVSNGTKGFVSKSNLTCAKQDELDCCKKTSNTTSLKLDAEQTSAAAPTDYHSLTLPSEGFSAPCPSNEPLVESSERKSSLFDAAVDSSKATNIKPNVSSGLAKGFLHQLPIPTPERLLPIGQYATESVSTIVEKVREGLAIPEITSSNETTDDRSDSAASCCHARDALPSSPRKLTKQSALESPPQALVNENGFAQPGRSTIASAFISHAEQESEPVAAGDSKKENKPAQKHTKRTKMFSDSQKDTRVKYAGSWAPDTNDDGSEIDEPESSSCPEKSSSLRIGDECICHRCTECGAVKEEYTDEEMGIMLIVLGTFIHREPSLGAPFLPEILTIVSRISLHPTFPWRCESLTHLPGGSQSVAHQFIRCVLHQLAPNGVFYQVFLTQKDEITRRRFYRSVSNSLNDFSELNPTSPIQMLAETLNAKKTLPIDLLPVIFRNLAEYLQCVPIDCIAGSVWLPVIQALDSLLRRVILILGNVAGSEHLLDIMVALLKVPQLSKSILEPFSKIISFAIQNLHLTQRVLVEICSLSGRAFAKERDKLYLGRQIVFDLVQALKFKINVPDNNLLLLVGFLLQDAGGILPPGIIGDISCGESFVHSNCNISECMRQPYLNDILEFLADFHTLSKIKNLKAPSTTPGLCEDTIGGVLKGAIAQYLALEMSRGNSKDSRTVSKYLPWLNNAPSSLQQGPKEFTECVGHMRLLSWLLMGSLTHTALIVRRIGAGTTAPHQNHLRSSALIIQPVPQEASCHIADHVQVIFAGFAEQSKTSVLHMSSLFHAFTLCQLWTVYLEQVASLAAISSEAYNITLSVLFEFWAKVTPCILQLVSHSKLSESVNLHFLGLLESLKETRSTILAKLLPLWTPVLSSNTQLSGTLHVRLQNCRDAVPNIEEQDFHASEALLKWLQRLQFKMGQIELQSSTATQFYSI